MNKEIILWEGLCDNMELLTKQHRPQELDFVTKVSSRIKAEVQLRLTNDQPIR